MTGELFFFLRSHGIDARLEVRVPSTEHKSGWMRVDIGVFSGKKLKHVIECKRHGKQMSPRCRQAKAYRSLKERFGVRVHLVNDRELFSAVLSRVHGNGRQLSPTEEAALA